MSGSFVQLTTSGGMALRDAIASHRLLGRRGEVSRGHLPETGLPGRGFLDYAEREILDNLERELHDVCGFARRGNPDEFIAQVMSLLFLLKGNLSQATWAGSVIPFLRSHEARAIVHQCPFTSHSFRRPRGYPGDAGLLDFVYRHPASAPAAEAATAVGRTIMGHTVGVSACGAVRRRKDILARKIDEAAERREGTSVLAVACGHLREAETSIALQDGRVGRFVATDQDEVSLATVAGYAQEIGAPIDARPVSVRQFVAGRHDLGRFDLIYAAGLYDYLDVRLSARLTRCLFDMLEPGGRLIVPNFRHGVEEEGFMEAYMDWYLIYRSQEQIKAFAAEIDPAELASNVYEEDVTGLIGYLELERA